MNYVTKLLREGEWCCNSLGLVDGGNTAEIVESWLVWENACSEQTYEAASKVCSYCGSQNLVEGSKLMKLLRKYVCIAEAKTSSKAIIVDCYFGGRALKTSVQ